MPTNTVRIKSGECAILPSDAVILSAATFGANPLVTSADCPELADLIDSKLANIVDGDLRLRDTGYINKNQADINPNLMEVRIFRARYFNGTNWLQFDVPSVEVDDSESSWKTLLAMTGTVLEGLIKFTGRDYRAGSDGRGSSVRITAKMPDYVRDNLVFDLATSNAQGQFDQVFMSVRFMQY